MKPPVFFLPLTLLALSACTSTHITAPGSVEAYRLSRTSQSKSATIVFDSGERVQGRLVRVEADTLRWFDAAAGANRAVLVHDVQEVRFVRHGRGAGQGLWRGALAGAGAGALYGAFTFEDDPCIGWEICTAGANAIWNGFVGSLQGALYGSLAGFIVGRRDRYVFRSDPSTPSR